MHLVSNIVLLVDKTRLVETDLRGISGVQWLADNLLCVRKWFGIGKYYKNEQD